MPSKIKRARASRRGKFLLFKLCPEEQRLEWAKKIAEEKITAFDLRNLHGYDPRAVQKMAIKYQSTGQVKVGAHRPRIIDSPGTTKINTLVDERREEHDNKDEEATLDDILLAAKETAERRGKAGGQVILKKRTKNHYLKKLNIVKVKSVMRNKARVEAVADPRNQWSWMGVLDALEDGQRACEHASSDSTQYQVTKKKVVMVKKGVQGNVQATQQGEDKTALNIKRWVAVTGNGSYSVPIFIIASPNLKKEECDWYEVPGLSQSSEGDCSGWMVFTKTRAGNKEVFFKEHMLTLDLLEKSEKALMPQDRGKRWKIHTADGEPASMPVAMSSHVQDMYKQRKVHLVKVPASCSLINQACDRMKDFLNTKKVVKDLSNNFVVDEVLKENVQLAVDEHRLKYKDSVTSENGHKIVDALCRIVFAMRRACTPCDVVKAFAKAHQFPKAYDTAIENCTTKLTKQEVEKAKEGRETIAAEFRLEGQCKEVTFNALGVKSMARHQDRKIHKDQRVLYHQRAVWLNHPKTVERWAEYKQDGLIAAKYRRRADDDDSAQDDEDLDDDDDDDIMEGGGGGGGGGVKRKAAAALDDEHVLGQVRDHTSSRGRAVRAVVQHDV
jgi:hypothetical protein